MDAPRELTYGERAQIKGLFLPGFGEFVHGTANPCGRRSSMFVELADQSWSRSIAPTVTTTYTVASDVEQTSATTIVRPAVLVRQTGRHSFQVMVRAGRSLAGKVVTVERFDSSGNGRWVRVGRVKLKRFVAHFRLAPAPLGVSRFVRAILPKSQVGPCYAAATSNELLVTRR
jgi:hypothetical protein